MAKVYQPVVVSRAAAGSQLPIALSREARVWASTKTLVSHKVPHPIADISFSPRQPHDLAIAYGDCISLISQRGKSVRKSFTRFRDVVYSPRFKHDGRLLVAGTADAVVKVFDVSSRTPLRTLSGHKGAVRSSLFSSDGLHVITGSDDATARVWDLAEGKSICSLNDATDYVRAMNKSPASQHVWVTGSFDHKARVYDLRSSKCLFTLDHGAHIDDVHVLPGGAMVVTVGGPEVRLWDLFTGGVMTNSLSCHAKAVTCAAVDGSNSRLLTAGLDGYVKVHDLLSFQTKGVVPVGAQVLSMDVSADLRSFAVGKADGYVEIKSSRYATPGRSDPTPEALPEVVDDEMRGWGRGFIRVGEGEEAKRNAPKPGTFRYFNRGKDVAPLSSDVVVDRDHSKKLSQHDKLLKSFDHVGALERALQTSNVKVVLGVIDELQNRNSLATTLGKMSIEGVVPLLKIIQRFICLSTHKTKLTLVLNVVLDIFALDLAKSADALTALGHITGSLEREIDLCRNLNGILGGCEMMLSVSSAN